MKKNERILRIILSELNCQKLYINQDGKVTSTNLKTLLDNNNIYDALDNIGLSYSGDVNPESEIYEAFFTGIKEPFYISLNPYDHKQYLMNQRTGIIQDRKPINQMTFLEFTGSDKVLEDDKLTSFEIRFIKYCKYKLMQGQSDYLNHPESFISFGPEEEGYQHYLSKGPSISFLINTEDNSLFSLYNGEFAGVIATGTRYVDPGYRGLGLGVAQVIFSYDHPEMKLLFPSHYSRSGYETRRKAFEEIQKRDNEINHSYANPKSIMDSK